MPRSFGRVLLRLSRRWPLRAAGLASGVLSAGALSIGRRDMDLVLTLAGSFGLALLAATGLCAGAGALAWRERVRRALGRSAASPLVTIANLETDTGLAVAPPRLPFLARPAGRWVDPPAAVALTRRGRGLLAERALPRERDLATHVRREWIVSDVFGLWRVLVAVDQTREVLVHPDATAWRESELALSLAAGDLVEHPHGAARGDRVDARPYNRSDPARLILWKVYARSRQLLVRSPESVRTPDARPLLFLACGEHDENAAGAARTIWETKLLGEHARFACDGAPSPVEEPREALRALAASRRHRARHGADLALALANDDMAQDDPVLVVAGVRDELTIATLLAVVRGAPARFTVLAVGSLTRHAAPSRSSRWLYLPDESGSSRFEASDAERALGPLIATGARVVLGDGASGSTRVLSAGEGASIETRVTA